jgi:hypothetical protein
MISAAVSTRSLPIRRGGSSELIAPRGRRRAEHRGARRALVEVHVQDVVAEDRFGVRLVRDFDDPDASVFLEEQHVFCGSSSQMHCTGQTSTQALSFVRWTLR